MRAHRNIQIACHLAVEAGHTEIVKLLLAVDGVDVNAKNNYGRTALHRAISNDHTEILKLLLAVDGVDVNAKDEKVVVMLKKEQKGHTALMLAAYCSRTDMIELLLGNDRVDHNATNNDGKTAYAIVLENAAKDAPERSDYVDSDREDEDMLEEMENDFQSAVACHEGCKVLVKTMPKMIARKSWRFLRLCIRIKRGLLRPYRIHKEMLSLAKDEWKLHDLNKKKTEIDQLRATVYKQQALIEGLAAKVN